MARQILIVGLDPYTLDFSLPGFPPGLTADKVELGIEAEREHLKGLGYGTEKCWLDNGVLDLSPLEEQLKAKQFDGVVVGAGVRVPPFYFILFEKIINVIHENAPGA